MVPSTGLYACVEKARADLRALALPGAGSARRLIDSVASVRVAYNTLRMLPLIRIPVTDTPAGRRIAAYARENVSPLLKGRARAVLTLPDDYPAYLTGRSRQAVRTNLTRAERAGTIATRIETPMLLDSVRRLIAAGSSIPYLDELLLERPDAGLLDWIARSSDDRILAIARLQVDSAAVWLKFFCAADEGAASAARYLLFCEIVRHLIGRRVRYLIVDLELRHSPGLAYFQDRLGFQPARLRIARYQ